MCSGEKNNLKLIELMKKNKWFIIFVFISFFLSCIVCSITNFNSINIADYLANIVHIETNGNGRFEFNLESKDNNAWFNYNFNAVSGISCLNSMNSSYMSYNYAKITRINDYSNSLFDDEIETIGITNGKEKFVPIGLEILYGDYSSNNYDCLIKNENDLYSTIISESLANKIVDFDNSITSISEVVGTKIYLNDSVTLFVDCIAKDSCLANNYSNSCLFVASNYLAFSRKLLNETMVFKLIDNYYSNYTLFNKIFIVGNFPRFFREARTLSVNFPDKEWIIKEAEIVYYNEETNLSVLLIICVLLYLPLGYFSRKLGILCVCKKESSIKCFSFLFLYLLFFFCAQEIFNGLIMFDIHINTKLAFSGVIEFSIIIIYIIGYLLNRLIKKDINNNLLEVHI